MVNKIFMISVAGLMLCTSMTLMHSDVSAVGTYETATFAGGCFWCMEPPFEKMDGVKEVISGYTGGHTENPTYEQVSSDITGHTEAVNVLYDPTIVTYAELLDVFWRQINPTDAGGQFVDRGSSYRTAIFYHSEQQRGLAEQSKKDLEQSGRFDKPIVTEIVPAATFYIAEDYHQDYYINHAIRYRVYRFGSGRDRYLDKVWGKEREKKMTVIKDKKYSRPSDEEIRTQLTPLQYKVTQKDGTERAFDNEYWDNKKEGIYVDIVSGEPLFSSSDKYKSGTGWPSFTKPIDKNYIVEKEDRKLFSVRTEIRSNFGDSHLGHVFDDGPEPTGLRYCMNSASLRFIPKEKMEEEGYGEYLKLLEE